MTFGEGLLYLVRQFNSISKVIWFEVTIQKDSKLSQKKQAICKRFNGYLLIVFYLHQRQELVNQEKLKQKKEGAFDMGLMKHPPS
jgi:hypothetical protein